MLFRWFIVLSFTLIQLGIIVGELRFHPILQIWFLLILNIIFRSLKDNSKNYYYEHINAENVHQQTFASQNRSTELQMNI